MATKKAAPKKSKALSKSTVRHPDTQKLHDLHEHIQERIADGGATTDHLKVMANMIKPDDDETEILTKQD